MKKYVISCHISGLKVYWTGANWMPDINSALKYDTPMEATAILRMQFNRRGIIEEI